MKNYSVLPMGTDFHCFFIQEFHQQKHRLKDQFANFIILFIKKKLPKKKRRDNLTSILEKKENLDGSQTQSIYHSYHSKKLSKNVANERKIIRFLIKYQHR